MVGQARSAEAVTLEQSSFIIDKLLRQSLAIPMRSEVTSAISTRNFKGLLFTLIVLAGNQAALQAQNYSIDWFKISGGGGTSTGGVYSVSGTIGQADADTAMSGGNYSLTGGFWSFVAAVQTPGAPTLTIAHSGSSVMVSWPYPSTGWTLQQNANLANANGWQTSSYSVTTNASLNSITITTPAAGSLFFRLFHP